MALFAYKALPATRVTSGGTSGGGATSGGEIAGTIAADTPRHARELLRERGLVICDVEPVRERKPLFRLPKLPGVIPGVGTNHQHLVDVVRELATLLAVGIPVVQALDTIIVQHKGALQRTLMQLRDQVSAGESLADAMRELPRTFDEMTVNVVEIGERSGTLEEVLERLAEFKERSAQLRGRIVTALIYPCIVVTMAIGITLLLMTFVVPNILKPLEQAGRDLPRITLIVKGMSDFIIHWWWALLIGFAGLIVAIVAILRSDKGQFVWHRWQLRIPILGNMIRKQAVVRIAIIISTLMKSGIVFLEAVAIARRSTHNRILKDALRGCEDAVETGRDIAEALDATKAFPPTVVQIFAVGQQSGRLEEMLDRLAVDYDRQVYTLAQRFTAILEPAMILLLAIMVGFIMFSVILPIMEAGNVL